MTKRRFKEFEIQKILQEHKEGVTIPQLVENYGISQATFYNWKTKYGNLSFSEINKMYKLREDLDQLKKMFADLSLENLALKTQLKKMENH